MSLSSDIGLSDIAAVTNNDGFGGNNGWWLILLILLSNGWNNGGGSVKDQYVLSSDFATLQRQLSDGFGSVERKGDSISNGLCDGFYTNAQLANQTDKSVMQSTNAIQSQLADCCCQNKSAIADLKYTMAMDTNAVTNAINQGFCQTNFNNQQNTRDIIANQDMNTRSILERMTQDKIDALRDENATLKLTASQVAQNQYLVNELRPCPAPAYVVPNPYSYSSGCGC